MATGHSGHLARVRNDARRKKKKTSRGKQGKEDVVRPAPSQEIPKEIRPGARDFIEIRLNSSPRLDAFMGLTRIPLDRGVFMSVLPHVR